VQVGSLILVVTQVLRRAGVDRDKAGCMELGFQDVSLWWIELQFDLIDA
jgi:hypothetical protein